MGAERKVKFLGVKVSGDVEARLHALRQVPGQPGRHGDVLERLHLLGVAGPRHLAGVIDHLIHRRLEHVGGELPSLVFDLPAGHLNASALDTEGPAAITPLAERAAFGIGVEDLDIVDGNAQLSGDDLAEGGHVRLAVRLRRRR